MKELSIQKSNSSRLVEKKRQIKMNFQCSLEPVLVCLATPVGVCFWVEDHPILKRELVGNQNHILFKPSWSLHM